MKAFPAPQGGASACDHFLERDFEPQLQESLASQFSETCYIEKKND